MKVINQLIVFMIAVTLSSSSLEVIQCPIVKCHDQLKQDETCFEKTGENVYSYTSCPKYKVCPTNIIVEETKKCISIVDKVIEPMSVEGDECYSSKDCASFLCDKMLCVGIQLHESCFNTRMCPKEYYCNKDTSRCETQIGIGEQCKEDFDCKNNAGCLNGVCKKFYTLDNGFESTNPIFCKSGFVWGFPNKPSRCTELKLLETDIECKEGQTVCRYEAKFGNYPSENITKPCECSYAYSDRKFCPKDSYQDLTKELLKKQIIYYNGEALKDHHSIRRGISKDKALNSRMYEIGMFPKFHQADKCALAFELGFEAEENMIGLTILVFLSLFLF